MSPGVPRCFPRRFLCQHWPDYRPGFYPGVFPEVVRLPPGVATSLLPGTKEVVLDFFTRSGFSTFSLVLLRLMVHPSV